MGYLSEPNKFHGWILSQEVDCAHDRHDIGDSSLILTEEIFQLSDPEIPSQHTNLHFDINNSMDSSQGYRRDSNMWHGETERNERVGIHSKTIKRRERDIQFRNYCDLGPVSCLVGKNWRSEIHKTL